MPQCMTKERWAWKKYNTGKATSTYSTFSFDFISGKMSIMFVCGLCNRGHPEYRGTIAEGTQSMMFCKVCIDKHGNFNECVGLKKWMRKIDKPQKPTRSSLTTKQPPQKESQPVDQTSSTSPSLQTQKTQQTAGTETNETLGPLRSLFPTDEKSGHRRWR